MAGEARMVESVCATVLKGAWNSLFNNNNIISVRLTSPTIVSQVLLRLSLHGYGVSHSWPFFKWLDSNSVQSLQSTWTMVHLLAKNNLSQEGHHLLEKISQRDFLSSPSVLNALDRYYPGDSDSDTNSVVFGWLMSIYGNLRMTREALIVFHHMCERMMKPQIPACIALLSCLAKDRKSETAWKVYKKMVKMIGCDPDVHMYTVMIRVCGLYGDAKKAESLMTEMELKLIRPNVIAYNALISLYCKRSLHYEAMCVCHRMKSAGFEPDIKTYNPLLHALCREGRMSEAVKLFDEIRGSSKVVPDEVTYTTMIDGYSRANDFEEGMRLFEVMRCNGLLPGVVAYNVILRLLCRDRRLREASRVLRDMRDRAVEPNNITCNTLINAYCKIEDMRSAIRVRDQMVRSGLKPDSFTHRAMVQGFCKVRDAGKAKEALFSMIDADFTPNYLIYGCVVDVLLDTGDEEAVLKIPEEFVKRGIPVNIPLCRSLIRRLCKRERLESAEKIYGLMKENGWPADSLIYTSLAYANVKAGNFKAFYAIMDEMRSQRKKITVDIYMTFSESGAKEDGILPMFWGMLTDKGLMSNTLIKRRLTHEV